MSDAFAAMEVEGDVGRVRTDVGRGGCRTRSHRWGSRAFSDAFAAMGVEGDVGGIRIEPDRPQRIDNQRLLPPPGGKPGERGALAPW